MSTHGQRQALVRAVQTVLMYCDDADWVDYVSDEECNCCDDGRIGGEDRATLASVFRRLRGIPKVRDEIKNCVRKLAGKILHDPRRWKSGYPRLYPKTITRKATTYVVWKKRN